MKILIDIAHPAHIHYFRNFTKILEQEGHECLYTLRDRGIIVSLAEYYNLNFRIRSKEGKSKLVYMFSSFYNIYKISREFRPDIFIDAGTVVASPVSALFRKPYIALEDTEIASKAMFLFKPFVNVILTPESFCKDLGPKQLRFKGFLELLYLHKNYFKRNFNLIEPFISNLDNFVLIRFVSWEAHHDVGVNGFSIKDKIKLVEYLSHKCQIVISSEGELPKELKKYRAHFSPDLIHTVLAKAKLVITEGGTTATEASVLGTPSILINPLAKKIGVFKVLQDRYGIQYHFDTLLQAMPKIEELMNDKKIKDKNKAKIKVFEKENIDCTSFLVDFVKKYK